MKTAAPWFIYLSLITVSFLWGASFAAAKTGLTELAPLNLVVLRFIIAAAVFGGILLTRPDKTTIDRQDVPKFILLGFMAITSYFYIQFTGLLYTTTINAALIIATVPAWTAVYGLILGWEKITPLKGLGILIAFAGVALIVTGGKSGGALSSATLPGDILILLNAVTWAGITIYGKAILQKYSPFVAMAWIHVFGTLMLLPFAFIPTPLAPVPLTGQLDLITWPTGASVLYLSLLCSVYAYYMWYRGVEQLGAVNTAAFSYFNPLFAAIIGVLLMGESLSLHVVGGGVVVLAGVYAISRAGRPSPAEKE